MLLNGLIIILIPFLGTSLGSAVVLFSKGELNQKLQKFLLGFASGVMIAASIWSLLIPSIEMAESQNIVAWIPATVGFLLGIGFLLLLDSVIPHMHLDSDNPEGVRSSLSKNTMLVLAVTLHNIPEGMAVGVMYAGFLAGNAQITAASALVLSLGIAIQNFPEGAIISMPLRAEGESKGKAFLGGVLSGVVEPIGAVLTILAAQLVIPALPYFLSFAAGAMLYVVVEELIPEMSQGKHSNIGTIFFAVGFSVMMTLDVALG
mgnify:CR=1 FL=1